ncbi:MAG: Rnf-Nqr domain containing protein [Oscillospiraceae bacterium]
MEILSKIIIAALFAAVLENTVLTRAFGTSTVIIASRNKKQSAVFGLCITYISTVSSIPVYFVDKYLSVSESGYLYLPVIYIAIIGVVYILTLLLLWKYAYKFFTAVRKFVHFSAFNSAVLGALFINGLKNDTIWEYIGYGFGTGIGFFIASLMIADSYEQLTSPEIPESFQGVPVIMIYIGIISMAFFALTGKIPLV